MKRLLATLASVFMVAYISSYLYYSRNVTTKFDSHSTWRDYVTFEARAAPIGVLGGDPLARLGLKTSDLREPLDGTKVRYLGKTRYLNNARAVVTHTIDDSTGYVAACLDAMDKYDIKATVFVSTAVEPISLLWPRLRQAIANGHEIGSHSRRHECQWPDTFLFCFRAYADYEVTGSRNDILAHTDQSYVWSWAYPCGNCADFDFVQRKLARAGYLVARPYPHEAEDGHLLPDLQTYDSNPYYARYTQVVQKQGGIAKRGRTDVAEVNAKFDEVYQRGGIYLFLSHPQWLDYGPEQFYKQHLAHIGGRSDVWYVPMGPLYAYHTVVEKTEVHSLEPANALARFAISNSLDPKVFSNSVTLEFAASKDAPLNVLAAGRTIQERTQGPTDRWDTEYFRRQADTVFVTIHPNTVLEFR